MSETTPKRAIDQFREDCEAVFSTPHGQRVLQYMAFHWGVAESVYGPGKTHDQMAFDDGFRSCVLWLMECADPEMRRQIEKIQHMRTPPYEPRMTESEDG